MSPTHSPGLLLCFQGFKLNFSPVKDSLGGTCLDTSDIKDTEDATDTKGRRLARRMHAVTRGGLHPLPRKAAPLLPAPLPENPV